MALSNIFGKTGSASLYDKALGSEYDIVRRVHDSIDKIELVAQYVAGIGNSGDIIVDGENLSGSLRYAADNFVSLEGRVTAIETELDSLSVTVSAINLAVTQNDGQLRALISQETAARTDATSALAASVSSILARVGSTEDELTSVQAAISAEQTARADADAALATSVTTLTARVGAAETGVSAAQAAIVNEQNTRASAVSSLASSLSSLTARVTSAEGGISQSQAAIQNEQIARAAADLALTNEVTELTSRVTNAEDSVQLAQANLAAEQTTRATADSALASSINSLSAEVTTVKEGRSGQLIFNGTFSAGTSGWIVPYNGSGTISPTPMVHRTNWNGAADALTNTSGIRRDAATEFPVRVLAGTKIKLRVEYYLSAACTLEIRQVGRSLDGNSTQLFDDVLAAISSGPFGSWRVFEQLIEYTQDADVFYGVLTNTTAVAGAQVGIRLITAIDLTSAELARNQAEIATTAATQASDSAASAATSQTLAASSASSAADSAGAANTSASNAATSANAAATSASSATTSANAASSSAAAADSDRIAAEAARTGAQSAQSSAESARDTAVSARNDAQGAASSAASSSTLAANSATDAGNSAAAAANFASNASTSASNAAGSASSAATSASVAASARNAVIRVDRNGDFINGLDGWVNASDMQVLAIAEGRANVIQSPVGTQKVITSEYIPITSSEQKFKLQVGFRSSSPSVPCNWYFGYVCLDAAGNYLIHTDGTGNYPLGGGVNTLSGDGWYDRSVVVGPGASGPSPYGGTVAFPPGAVSFVLIAFVNYLGADTSGYIDYFKATDVTSEVNAAASATAAATSASNAAASATTAGQQASAAQTSATNAATSAGNASTSASQAATSASNAAGSANTASTQATAAANSASSAGSSATAAATSATSASTSASNAANSALSASTSASTAQSSATSAGTSATNAANSATSASNSAASASNSAVLAANVGTGALNPNASFDDFPSGSVGALPNNWLPAADTSLGYRVSDGNGGYAWRLPSPAGVETYAYNQSGYGVVKQNDWFVLEADVTLNSGSLSGAGVLFRVWNVGSSNFQDITLVFFVDKDSSNQVIGNGVAGRTYRYRKLVQVTIANADYYQFWTMSHWSGLGSTSSANDITWLKNVLRPATQAEIDAGTVLPAVQATVTTNSAAIASLEGATAHYETIVAADGSNPAMVQLKAGKNGSKIGLVADKIALGNSVDGIIQYVLSIEGGQARLNNALIRNLQVAPRADSQIFLPVTLQPLVRLAKDGDAVLYQNGDSFGAAPQRITGDVTSLPAPAPGSRYEAKALNITATGFTASVKVISSATLTNQTSAAGTNVGGTPQWRTHKPVADDAYDGNYQYQFDVSIPRTSLTQLDIDPVMGRNYLATYSGTFNLYYHNGSTYVIAQTVTIERMVEGWYMGTSQPAATMTLNNEAHVANITANIPLTANQEFGIHAVSGTITGFDFVKYTSESSGTTTSVTTDIPWTIFPPLPV